MTRTAAELAKYLGTRIEGNGSTPVSGVASPERAGPEDLIYIDGPRYAERAAASAARCVLTLPELQLAGKALLRVAEPKLAFAKAAAWLLPRSPSAAGVHPTAIIAPTARLGVGVSLGPYVIVEDDVEIGADCEVGAFSFLGRGALLGDNCRLFPHVTLYSGVRLGHRVVIHAGAVIGGDGFGYVFGEGRYWKFPQVGSVVIGDDVEIGCNTTIDRGSLETTRVAAGVKIDNLVQVAHNVQIGAHSVIAAQTGISGSSVICEHVIVGGQVGIADHCTIQDGAILGAQAGIPSGKRIAAGQTVWGTPARPLARFKEQYAWFGRLPELAERLGKIERAQVDTAVGPEKNG